MKKLFFLLILLTTYFNTVCAQDKETAWDNTLNKNWPVEFIQIGIKSTVDSSVQKAWFYKSRQSAPQPLIVSLHTWSGDYNQEDPLTKEILLRDWNYIHPNFRGSNNTPNACGSTLVIADLEDAIEYAVKNGHVDPTEVHIIGVSGGGYATLLAFMKINYPVKSFSAWASISNLEDWYWECKGRASKYAHDLEMVTTNGNVFNPAEARKRSPLFMPFQPEKRKGSFLNIYAGIHDGYTGSVPITHSIYMFDKLVKEMYPEQEKELVSDSIILSLVTKQLNPSACANQKIGGREIYLSRKLPQLHITLFEGTHEMLVPQALSLIQVNAKRDTKKLNILTIGDSNGTFRYSWPQQLKNLLPYSTVVNKSISGNTIGFDNLDQPKLNTLKNIDRYLEEACEELGKENNFDIILIGLGTNDTKKIFEKRQNEVGTNLVILVKKIREFVAAHKKINPSICVISPAPMDEQKVNKEKYGGGDERIQNNNEQFKKLASENQFDFLDTYTSLKSGFSEKTIDGVHLNEKAQFEMAIVIANYLEQK